MKAKPTNLPPLAYMIGINKAQALQLAAFGTLLIFLSAAIFSYLTGSGVGGTLNPALALAVYVVTLAVHEAVHGLFFRLFGGQPKYGVGLMYYFFPYAYATAHGQPYSLRQMVVIGMSPLVLVCAAALAIGLLFPATIPYAAIAFVGNFSGAIGDMWLLRQVLRFRRMKQLVLVDLKSGLAVHTPDKRVRAVVARMDAIAAGSNVATRLTKVWGAAFGVLILISLVLPIVLLEAVGYQGHLVIGPAAFPLFEIDTSPNGFSTGFNALGLAVAAFLFALLYTLLSRKTLR